MDSSSDTNSRHLHPKRIKTTHEMQLPSASTSTHDSKIPNLPFELIIEILLRLPVKSLLIFKCVSKSWRTLIGTRQFVKAHLAASSNNVDYAHHRLIFTILPPNYSLKQCSLHSSLSAPVTEVSDVNYPMKHPSKSVWVVGFCNGLACVAIEEKALFFWNPAIKKSKKLPNLNIRFKSGCYILYGFGYDESEDDYKVVGIFCVFSGGGVYETEVNIYSLKSDSWRRIEDFKGGAPFDDCGKYTNGKLHWTASSSFGSSDRWKIVSLDLAKETYGEMDQPDYGSIYDWTFGVLDGSLSVLCNYERTRADLWIMKEYGVRKSWTKLVSIPYLSCPDKSTYSTPLCILKNGEILLLFGSVLLLYNPKLNSFRYPQLSNVGTCLEVDMYVESLVSPISRDGLERQLE